MSRKRLTNTELMAVIVSHPERVRELTQRWWVEEALTAIEDPAQAGEMMRRSLVAAVEEIAGEEAA